MHGLEPLNGNAIQSYSLANIQRINLFQMGVILNTATARSQKESFLNVISNPKAVI